MSTKIRFKKLNPFDIAYYDTKRKTIYIEPFLKDRKKLFERILSHEKKHSKNKNFVDDYVIDLRSVRYTMNDYKTIMRKKPLFLLFSPIAFIWYDKKNGIIFDQSRLVNFIILSIIILVLRAWLG